MVQRWSRGSGGTILLLLLVAVALGSPVTMSGPPARLHIPARSVGLWQSPGPSSRLQLPPQTWNTGTSAGSPAVGLPSPWTNVSNGSSPSERGGAAYATDPTTNLTLLYGGVEPGGFTVANDTWSYADGIWHNLSRPHAAPALPLDGAGMVYYPAMNGFILFGGGSGGSTYALTWIYKGGAWSQLTPAGRTPSPRAEFAFVYDAAVGFPVLFGGWGGTGISYSDTWTFINGNWSDVSSTVGTPPARGAAVATYDPLRQAVVVSGGASIDGSVFFNDTWELVDSRGSLSWKNVTSAVGPAPFSREMATMAFDPAYGYDLFFGGDYKSPRGWKSFSDLWSLEESGWVNLTSGIASLPPPRFQAALFFDPSVGDETLFGGCTTSGCSAADNATWTFSFGFAAGLRLPGYVTANTSLTISAEPFGAPLAPAPNFLYNYSGLPPGCLSADQDQIACVPSVLGRYQVDVSITDSGAPNGSHSLYALSPSQPLQVITPMTAGFAVSRTSADVGESFWINSSAIGGTGVYTYTYVGLPAGCSPGNVSSLRCTPTFPGIAFVEATAQDTTGASISSNWTFSITPAMNLTGRESASVVDVGMSLTLNVSWTGGSGGVVLSWSVPGGGCPYSAAATLVCTPAAPGYVTPLVHAFDSNGGGANLSFPGVTVHPKPGVVVQASPDTGPPPLTVQFTVFPAGGTGPFFFRWEFGDGTGVSYGNISHTYLTVGVHSAHLWANDSAGGDTEQTILIGVANPPVVSVSAFPGIGEVGIEGQFSALIRGGVSPLTVNWTGLPAGCVPTNSSELTCIPTDSGTFTPTATVQDAYGSIGWGSGTVLVTPPLALSISSVAQPGTSCPNAVPVQFSALTDGGVAPFHYRWAWGDGGVSSQPDVTHTYAVQGTFLVALLVTDSAGANRSANETVTVSPPSGACLGGPWQLLILGIAAGAASVGTVVWLIGRRGGAMPPRRDPHW